MNRLPIYRRKLPSGTTAYQVDLGIVGGKRKWKSFTNKKRARIFAERQYLTIHNNTTAALCLDMPSMQEASECIERLKPHGVTMRTVTEYYLLHVVSIKRAPTIKGIINRMVRKAVKAGRREKTILELKSRLGLFAKQFVHRRLRTVSFEELDKFIDDLRFTPRTKINYLTKISQVYNFAIRHQWAEHNLAKRIDRPSLQDDAGPAIYTIEECVLLLDHAQKFGLLPFVVLGLFRGIRTHELLRLRFERINLLDETTAAWLSICAKSSGEIVELKGDQFFDARSALHEAAGVEPKQNGLRHSFASYHIAKFKDAKETARILGHTNVNLVHDYYKQLVKEKDAERFWSL